MFSTDIEESKWLKHETEKISKWFMSPRFSHIRRPYSPYDVAKLRCPIPQVYPSDWYAKKLYRSLRSCQQKRQYLQTFGSLDPIQTIQMSKYLKCIYVSGWQSSSTASSNNEPGPDLADYPYDTVPRKVDQLIKAQIFHDRKQREERSRMSKEELSNTPRYDFLCPIIADADTGHGGINAVMKLTKMFIEAGAAGIHLEDQRHGAKKCGHMGGKVLVSTQTHIDRLIAARLQADIMDTELIIVARTDSEAAKLIDTNGDPFDHQFILGTTNKNIPPLVEWLKSSKRNDDFDHSVQKWENEAKLCTFQEAVAMEMERKGAFDKVELWFNKSKDLSHDKARALAKEMGYDIYWDWDKPRTIEGFFRIKNGIETGIERAKKFAPYADLLWLETAKPDIKEAKQFAEGVRQEFPNAMLAYNLSPSFNWSNSGMTDKEIYEYMDRLGELGYVWQFITLAGFHSNALSCDVFAREFAKRKMLAYVELIQRPEKENNVETLKHQAWSGAHLIDRTMSTVQGGLSSTLAMSSGVTEKQFISKL